MRSTLGTEQEALSLRVAGLFAGIGGIELGLHRSGHRTVLLCENDPAAEAVLRHRFMTPGLRTHEPLLTDERYVHDVADVRFPAEVEVIAAGFPCTDVSQAGRTAGIRGKNTGLVQHLFRHLDDQQHRLGNLRWLLLENVSFLLQLDGGHGMRFLVDQLESRGFCWAYRVVDSQAFGLPQRRQRVILLASRTEDPRQVLLVDDADPIDRRRRADTAIGFYWTEGLRGLGWAIDAVPTLKGGSTLGIPSAPAVWLPDDRIVTPHIETAERLQGFPRGWTAAATTRGAREGVRWKLVGNAVSVPISQWVGRRLHTPHSYAAGEDEVVDLDARPCPTAGWGLGDGKVHRADVSMWPVRTPYRENLARFMRHDGKPLSPRATLGFLTRLMKSGLQQRRDDAFVQALITHYFGFDGLEVELPHRGERIRQGPARAGR